MSVKAIIDALSDLCEHEELRVAVEGSIEGASLVGKCALAGGLLGGPIGLGIGNTYLYFCGIPFVISFCS